jgi:hypothetical protein
MLHLPDHAEVCRIARLRAVTLIGAKFTGLGRLA